MLGNQKGKKMRKDGGH